MSASRSKSRGRNGLISDALIVTRLIMESRSGVTWREIADELEIHPRTAHRWIESAEVSLPVAVVAERRGATARRLIWRGARIPHVRDLAG